MRKKQFLQFRRAMATLLAVAMIGQNTVMTTAENYVADNTAVVAEEQAQEPEVQVEEAASPAVQESAPAAETPTEPAAQAVAETPAEPAAQAVAETPAEPAAQAVAETPAEPAAQAVAEKPAEPAAQEVVETPAEPAGQTVAKTPETPAEQEPSVSAETSSGSASQEPAADADKASAAEAEIDGNTVPAENPSPELGKEVLYRITFNGDAAAHGTIQVKGETAPVDVASYNKEVKENEKFEFSITAAQGYETERVTLEADGTQLVKNAEGFYEIPAVTKAENILVTYKEIPQEPAANTGSTEESEEEPAEEPIEENTDELEMPVFDYSGSCAGVTAAIYAEEGVLPEGTTVELAPLSDAQIAAAVSVLGCEVSDILGLDITFIYNGEEIQPSGNVAVSFTAAEIADVDVTSVYHVGDDGAVNEVAASQEGSSLGFTTDSFSGYLVNLAGLNGQPSETAITGNTTVAVGETITLTGSRNTNCSYEQKWESTDSSKAVIFKAKGNSAEVTGIEEGKVTITHTYCSKWKKNHWPHQENSESIEVTVTAPVYATELSLPETVSVERGSTVTITPISLKPENATLTWKSDNSAVATVDSKGIVTGKKPGTATISAQSGDRIATTTVTVKAISGGSDNTGKSWSDVEFYYLKTPTSDKNSNSVDQWGSCLGIGSIDLTGATWDANNKNTFDNVPARVITWPSGGTGSTYTVTKNSAAWKEILKYWKTQIQNNLEVEITDDDIESITLTPYKISRNEKYHVDCTIDIKCKRVVTAKYFLWDAGTNVTQYDQVYAKSFVINKGTTQPSDSDKLSLPLAKTVDGKNYTLKAWYSNSSLQGEIVTFPYSIGESNVNFYAKYVRSDIKYTVNYYWNGTTEKVADSVTGFGGEPGNVITETPKMINGYTPVSYEKKQLVISENGTNEINFYYFKNVELTANSATATYDGKEHSVSGYTGVPEGVSFAGITVGATGTNAGEYPAAFAKGTVGMTDGTGKYIVSKAIDGKLEIGKAAVTLKSATLSKKYDGNALVNGDTALEIESGFAEGEGATYNFTGSQTVVGSSANAFSYELNGNTNIDNYEISKQEGTLTVTNREAKYEITVKANSATATYDGKEHEAVGVETYEFTVEGNSYTVSGLSTEDPKQKDAGSYTNNITGTPVVTDKEGNVVTSEFEVKTENGSLTITPRQVNLTSESASKPYDGTPLTRPSVTGGDGFVAGEVTDIRATGSVTNVSEGEVTNTITYTTGEKFNADNYNITPEEGKLSITASQEKVTVTITGHTNTEKYDGTPKKAEGYEAVIASDSGLYKEADFSFSGTAEVEKTDAAETAYPMGLAAGQFKNTNTNFANVEFVVTDGALTITPRQVILTSATDEKVYDGTPLTNHNVTVSGDGFAAGEGVAYDVTGTQTDKGSSDNTFTYKLNEDTKASNYNIEIAVGKLTVKESEKTVVVTIKGNTDGKTYDGTEHSVSGYQVESIKIGENDTNLYTENDFEFSGKAEAKGTNAGTYPMGLKEAQFTNKNGNFTSVVFVVTDGKLEISPRQVTLTSESANKPYDGTALTRPDVAGGDGFVAGEVTDIRATGSVTNVSEGEVTNTITYTTGEKFNADNYNITPEEGKLSITASQEKVTVTITGHTNTEKYDGTPKKAEGYEAVIASDSGLYKEADFSFSGTAEVEKTDAAETAYPMGLAAGQFKNTNTNFANVEFVVTDGALTITPRQVILTSATDEKVYDGTPLTNHTVTVSGDGFAAGEGADYEVTGTQTDSGSSDNTFTYKLNENTKASNYSIELAPGELTVTPVTDKVIVTITEHSASLKYNGAEQSVTGYDTAIDNTLYKETDFTFSGDATAKGTDFGSYPMNLKAEDFTNKNKNFANVVFEIVDGQLEITKRDVELISGSDEKVYDGTPLTKNHILIAGDQFVPGEGADYDVTGSQTNAGSSDNEFTYRLNSSTKAINYNIKTTPGTLKVTPVTDNVIVTITEHSGSAKYDGTEKTVTGYDVAIDNELYTENDFTFSGNDVIKATDADIYNMELKPSDFNNISHNFASVTFKIVDGTLNISRRDVTLTSATDSKTYDGKPLTNDNVAVGGDGFAEGEGAVYNVTGSQTEAGFSNNTFSYELKDNTKTDNYNITSFEGILTVSSSEDEVVVTITGNKDTQKYDGTEKTVEGYTVSITSPLYKESDFTFDGTALVKGTNADTYMMGLSEENFTNTNKNFAKVTFHVIDGSLVIEKRNLVLTSASAQKVYNGTELTAKDVTVSGDGFVKGEGASYDVTGTQTTVGDSENTFTYKLNENTNADNYTIETKNGSLLVTPVTDQVVVTLKENSGTEVYDGTEKTVTGYTVADISNKLYTDKDFTFTGNAEVKGTDAGTYDMELKAEDFQNINPNFTNVVFKVEDGALEITRRQVTFQADSGEKKYDGEELAVPTWKLEDGTLADGQQEIAHVEGSQTLVGESENKITDLKIFANAASQKAEGSETEAQDVTKNYSIILLAGLLKVTDGSEEDPVDPGQVVTKTHEDKTYDLDETVTFTINVKNIYDEAKTVRIIELPGVVIEGAPQETPNVLTVEKVPAGETVTATETYKITEADIANGSFVNTVKVEFEGGKPFENTDTVTTVDPVRSYTLTKKSSESTHENGMFKAGETIHYTLTVTNTGNQTLENVEITDTLNAAGTISNIQGADSKQDGKVTIFTISSLAPKAEATITYDYVVQEADKGNTISNAAVGTPANPEDPDGEKPGDNTDNPVENPKLEVKKDIVSITAADGTQKDKAGKADLNDIITYSVTVTNTGNMKLTNVKITDSLEGIQLAEGQSFDLGILEAGEAKTVTYTYQVKESDLGKSILNTATATGDVPENPADTPKPEGKDEKEVPTEDPANCSITVTKRLTNIQGELLAVRAADFYVTLFSDEAMTQKAADTKMIHFDENQGTSSVTFDQLKRGTYYVAETDAEGKVVAEGTYNNGSYVAQYQAGNKVEITENGTAAQFQFDNQFLLLPDEYYIVKTITINKTVVKKNGEDLKSEETFYAGIFKDEDCTQLADGVSQNIVPLVMDGESTATAKTEVTVPVGGEEIKLYVTEVTADGTPVALNDTFEYDVEINDGFVTLSETSEDATVLIINTSRKEEPEPTAEPAQEPTEAPAEPTQAPQITQQPEDRAVTTNGVKTGDDSPLTQLAFMLFAASAAILLIIFLKKKDEKDIMK